jgi:hypothetical protein
MRYRSRRSPLDTVGRAEVVVTEFRPRDIDFDSHSVNFIPDYVNTALEQSLVEVVQENVNPFFILERKKRT